MPPKKATPSLIEAVRNVLHYPTPFQMSRLAVTLKALGHAQDESVETEVDHYATEMVGKSREAGVELLSAARRVLKDPTASNLSKLAQMIKARGYTQDERMSTDPASYDDVAVRAGITRRDKAWVHAIEQAFKTLNIDPSSIPTGPWAEQITRMLKFSHKPQKSVSCVVPGCLSLATADSNYCPEHKRLPMHQDLTATSVREAIEQDMQTEKRLLKGSERYHGEAKQWLKAHLGMVKIERMREKRQLTALREGNPELFANMIEQIDADIGYIESLEAAQ